MPFAAASPSPLGPPTHSAVIVSIPEAEPVVGHHRRVLDESAPWGVPAHVTVLFPFMDPTELDDDVHAKLSRAVATVPEFTATFGSTAWFDEKVLWLAPDPAEPFRALTTSVAAAFPEHPPYGGKYQSMVPHLTVAMSNDEDLLARIEADLAGRLPIRIRVHHAALYEHTPDGWKVRTPIILSRVTPLW